MSSKQISALQMVQSHLEDQVKVNQATTLPMISKRMRTNNVDAQAQGAAVPSMRSTKSVAV